MGNKDKRVPKSDIKFKVSLTEEQKEAKSIVLNNKISVISGVAGTSKTFTAVQIALDRFFKREVERITIMRPTVGSEDIGALPGTVDEKMSMWMIPIVENMYLLYDKAKIDSMLAEGYIRMLPLQFTQGITFVDEFVILDESQNATADQISMVLTRLGKGSRMVLTGDPAQIQLRQKGKSGLQRLIDITDKVNNLECIEMQVNHRDPIVAEIVEFYNK
tara:strand:+ start:473 stop:1126 length:654 start_codon:yes stop_codon:yes gene_type:complete